MTQPSMPEAKTQKATTATPSLPSVNLLPPEIAEAARFRRFQLAMVAAGVGAVVIVGGLAYSAHHGVASAKSQLAAAKQQEATLQGQLAGLQSVRDVYAQVAAKNAMLQQAMSSEIRWSYYMTDLSLKIPQNVWLTNVTATEQAGGPSSGSTPTAVTGTSALTPTGVGSVTFSGVAFSHDDVATWLDALAKERGFVNAYFSNSTKSKIGSKEVVDFSSSVTLSPAALSGRYAAGASQ